MKVATVVLGNLQQWQTKATQTHGYSGCCATKHTLEEEREALPLLWPLALLRAYAREWAHFTAEQQ